MSCLVQAIADACTYAIAVHRFSTCTVTFLSVTDMYVFTYIQYILAHIARMQPGLGCLALMCSVTSSMCSVYLAGGSELTDGEC